MRISLLGTFGFALLAACGDSESRTDAALDAIPDTIPDAIVDALSETQGPDGDAAADEVEPEIEVAVEVVPDTVGDTGDATDEVDAGPDAWDRSPAWLSVTLTGWNGNPPRTVVAGALWAAPEPAMYAVAEDAGSCRLSYGENFFCDPPCEAGVCTAPDPEDVCTPYPALLSAGTVVVSGAGEVVSMKAGSDGGGGYASEHEGALWASGTELTFSAEGSEVPAFTTALRMIEPMIGKDLAALDLKRPLVIEWEPPTASGAPTRVNIMLQADRGQHGRAYSAVLECDVPDSGRFEIPAALQAKYVADDIWGCGKCPASKLTRYTRTRVVAGTHALDVSVEAQETFLLTPWSTRLP